MKGRTGWRISLLLLALGSAAFLGARTVAEEAAVNNFERDAVEFDRTRDRVADRLTAAAESMKQIARDAMPGKDSEEDKKARNEKIQQALQGFFLDSYALALQTHILSLDSMADRGGQAAEGTLMGALAARFKVPVAEFVDRRTKSKLGLGGVALGYAIAIAAKLTPDEIFSNKEGNRTWLEVMNDHHVSVQDIGAVFEEQKS